jgi:hypothetical protein
MKISKKYEQTRRSVTENIPKVISDFFLFPLPRIPTQFLTPVKIFLGVGIGEIPLTLVI